MRKPKLSILILLTVAFATFTLGFLLGSNRSRDAVTVSVPRSMLTEPAPTQPPETTEIRQTEQVSFPLDLNRAGKEELMALPGIGEVLAQRILDYREENGSFEAAEQLLNVEGIGKNRLEEILDLITIGG